MKFMICLVVFLAWLLSKTGASTTGTERPSMGHHYQRDAIFHGIFGP
jgi:hypothetical protein